MKLLFIFFIIYFCCFILNDAVQKQSKRKTRGGHKIYPNCKLYCKTLKVNNVVLRKRLQLKTYNSLIKGTGKRFPFIPDCLSKGKSFWIDIFGKRNYNRVQKQNKNLCIKIKEIELKNKKFYSKKKLNSKPKRRPINLRFNPSRRPRIPNRKRPMKLNPKINAYFKKKYFALLKKQKNGTKKKNNDYLIAPGVEIGEYSEIGTGCGIGINVRISKRVRVMPETTINHYAKIGEKSIIGTKCYIGLKVEIGQNINIPNATVIPDFLKILTQEDLNVFLRLKQKRIT